MKRQTRIKKVSDCCSARVTFLNNPYNNEHPDACYICSECKQECGVVDEDEDNREEDIDMHA